MMKIDSSSFALSLIRPLPSWIDMYALLEEPSTNTLLQKHFYEGETLLSIEYVLDPVHKKVVSILLFEQSTKNIRATAHISWTFLHNTFFFQSITLTDAQGDLFLRHTIEYTSAGQIVGHEVVGKIPPSYSINNRYYTQFTYDAKGRIASILEQNGKKSLFSYQENALLTRVYTLEGFSFRETSFFDSQGRITFFAKDTLDSSSFQTNPTKGIWNEWEYKECNHSPSLFKKGFYSPLGEKVMSFSCQNTDSFSSLLLPTNLFFPKQALEKPISVKALYNSLEKPLEVIFDTHIKREYPYYLDGALEKIVLPLGKTIEYKNNALGQCVEMTIFSKDMTLEERICIEYEFWGPTTITSSSGIRTCYSYSDEGNIATSSLHIGKERYTKHFAYTPSGGHECIEMHDEMGNMAINNTSSMISKAIFPVSYSWEELQERALKAFYTIYEKSSSTITFAQKQLDWFFDVRSHFEDLAFKIIDKGFWILLGYNPDKTHQGKWNGEIEGHPKIFITQINGILSAYSDATDYANMISQTHGGMPVHYVYAATQGFTTDIIRCIFAKMGIVSEQAKLLAKLWKKLIQEMGGCRGQGKIIHYAHSLGGTDTYNALKRLSPEERKHVHIITFGSASLIPEDNVINYIAFRDAIPYFDPIGYISAIMGTRPNVNFIGSRNGIPLVDHLLFGETYRGILEELGAQFQKESLSHTGSER